MVFDKICKKEKKKKVHAHIELNSNADVFKITSESNQLHEHDWPAVCAGSYLTSFGLYDVSGCWFVSEWTELNVTTALMLRADLQFIPASAS